MEGSERVTIAEAARMIGISQQGLREYVKRGIIPIGVAVPDLGQGKTHRYFIPRDKLEAFLGRGGSV